MKKEFQYFDVNRIIKYRRLNCLFSETNEVKENRGRLDRRLGQNLRSKLKNDRNISFAIEENSFKLEALRNFKRTQVYQTNLDESIKKRDEKLAKIQERFKAKIEQKKPFKSYIDYLKQKKATVSKLLNKNQKFKAMLDDDLENWFKTYEKRLLADIDTKIANKNSVQLNSSNNNGVLKTELYEEVFKNRCQLNSDTPKDYWLHLPRKGTSNQSNSLLLEANQMLHPYIHNERRPSSINVKRMSQKIKQVLGVNKRNDKPQSILIRKSKFGYSKSKVATESDNLKSNIDLSSCSQSGVSDKYRQVK